MPVLEKPVIEERTFKSGECADKLTVRNVNAYYGGFQALRDISLDIPCNAVTSFIGPSGCGKSTFLRLFNRMNDLIEGFRVEGSCMLDGIDINDPSIDVVEVRSRIGMMFQKPNPFPMTIFENVAYGPRRRGVRQRSRLTAIVEKSLRQAALWDEVKDKLQQSGLSLSGGQQQRLCLARTLAVEPDVILMDEPCSALDPVATLKIENLMRELIADYTIVIVTHNMQQAARVSDMAAFLMMEPDRAGILVEYAPTSELFTNPRDKRTEDYITGRFG